VATDLEVVLDRVPGPAQVAGVLEQAPVLEVAWVVELDLVKDHERC
jgi:hypothetical protein